MSEHRRSGRHTKPSEKNEINQNEINHMEETKYNRASADKIPSEITRGDEKRRSITHHYSSTSPTSAASIPEHDAPREKFDELRRRSFPNPPSEAILSESTPKQSSGSGSDFYEPFGAPGGSILDGSSGSVKGEDPRVQKLPAVFRLESTHFVAKAICGSLSSKELQEAIEKALPKSDIDIPKLVDDHFLCSYHQGNRVIGLNVRVFEPPRSESGQLLDSETTIAEKIEGGFLVEVQLREGDRLHFSSLFRKLLTNFSELEGVTPTGTLRYKPHPSPWKGEGLVLETVPHGDGDSTIEPLDEKMIEDVFNLVETLQSDFLDTQPDAATAVTGLTSDDVAESSAAITSASSFTAPPPHDPQGSVSEISDDRSQAVEDELIEQNTGNDNPMPEFGVSRGSRRPIWDYLCQSTGQAATSNCTLVVTIFCSATVTGIAEENDPLWISSLSVVVLLFAATSVAFCLALPEVARNSRVTSEEPPV